ncbi:hypothetical protein TVAG_063000 [Trichomonas vaginalis G3]|uniref:SMP-LTD domain-containing protein n=1 Tax=Trichomonas vaginalis (strain ATCC PRA-98 / G3) TaxID=412133 RepID=A2DLR2_TRIV3|nr:mitochondrial distribution and morphology protein 12 family [Trichomonas vaginalis G3]EAY18695.1 hypothetical protein TVAG_063000 [Trichomonas vaginalis G3]KAI5522594.1 mitochondrial distribution and morphology protein 12 family [Trichomonas vaginalis G3]|eukprot:XP_001579681.1 hypothetical protein [Trichomonas vaginalis G3]
MSLRINWDALQSYVVQERTIEYITQMFLNALKDSPEFSSTFMVNTLSFGTIPPTIDIISMKDIDVKLQWHLKTHIYELPQLQQIPFNAPFQATVSINWESNGSFAFSACLSYDKIAPGCIKFPFNASISNLSISGKLCILYLGDAIIAFFEKDPDFNFQLELSLGAEEKVFDQHQVRDLICEILRGWTSDNIVHPNSLKFPFNQPTQ